LVRLHRVQAKMNLRYFLESTVHAGYALAHPETTVYFDLEKQELGDAKKATGHAHRWILQAFPGPSDFIKGMKEEINRETAHANVINSKHNFSFVSGDHAEIQTSYFDFEDDRQVRVDLWMAAKAGLHAADFILAVQRVGGGFVPKVEAADLQTLMTDNDAVLSELQREGRQGASVKTDGG
jgi:hypothetical protein